jgi:hypothetical protein
MFHEGNTKTPFQFLVNYYFHNINHHGLAKYIEPNPKIQNLKAQLSKVHKKTTPYKTLSNLQTQKP